MDLLTPYFVLIFFSQNSVQNIIFLWCKDGMLCIMNTILLLDYIYISHITLTLMVHTMYIRRVSRGGGPKGPGPPLEIEKQKKKVIRANGKLFHLDFCYFFSRKSHFLS